MSSAVAVAVTETAPGADAPPDERDVLGVLAGAGALPRLVVEAELRRNGAVFVIDLARGAAPWIAAHPHTRAGFGQVGRIFSALRAAGCRRVVFAGAVSRPNLFALRFDLTALTVAVRVARLLRAGDDGLLRGIARIFEERGFELVAPQALLGDLLAPAGVLGRVRPSPADFSDIARAAEIASALGAVDVGQGAVVAQGRCLGLETVQGTDAMLKVIAGSDQRGGARRPSGALFKAPKPQQDRRLDLPAIGPKTLEGAHAAGLNGVAVRAGEVFVLDIAETVAAADRLGLFVYGVGPGAVDAAEGADA